MNSFQACDFTYPKDKRTGQYGVVSPGETKMTLSQNSMGLIIRMLLCMMKGSHPSGKDGRKTVLNTELRIKRTTLCPFQPLFSVEIGALIFLKQSVEMGKNITK